MCIYRDCPGDECDTKYEVCSENPLFKGLSSQEYTCYAVFTVSTDTDNITAFQQHCFVEEFCSNKCTLELHPSDIVTDSKIYDCCCTGNLCNNVSLNLTGTEKCTDEHTHSMLYTYKFFRDVVFEVFMVNWLSAKFSSSKFHWQSISRRAG